jgi:hypothetical protein
MQSKPIFLGEAQYERWLNSALEAERQRLRLQAAPDPAPSDPPPPARPNENVHTRREGGEA